MPGSKTLFVCSVFLTCIAAQASASETTAKPYYIPANITSSFQLDPPHTIGSPEDQQDIQALESAQKERTDAECKRAQSEATPIKPSYQEFFGMIGPFPTPLQGEAKEFIVHVWSDASLVSETFKNQYKWKRAFKVDAALKPCVEKTSSFSYPSGHALMSRVYALVLSDIDASKKDLYLARADEIARDRLIGGMHRPNELVAGKKLADEIHEKLLKSSRYLQDIEKMKVLLASKKG